MLEYFLQVVLYALIFLSGFVSGMTKVNRAWLRHSLAVISSQDELLAKISSIFTKLQSTNMPEDNVVCCVCDQPCIPNGFSATGYQYVVGKGNICCFCNMFDSSNEEDAEGAS